MTSPSDINAGKAVIGVVLDDSTIKQQMEGTAARMQASAAGIHASTISTLKEQLKAGTITQEEYTAAVNRSKKSLEGATLQAKEAKTSFGGLKGEVASMVAGFASMATVAAVIRSVGAEFKAIEDEALLAEKLSITNDRFQGLKIAAQQADVELETLTTAMQLMSVAIGKASLSGEESTKWLNRMGLTLGDLIGLSADQQFLMIAEAMRNTLSTTEQLAASAEIFGRSSTDMVRLLQLTSDGLDETTEAARRTGQAVGDLAVDQIKKANDALDAMSRSVEGLKRSLAVLSAPALTEIANNLEDIATNINNIPSLSEAMGPQPGSILGNAIGMEDTSRLSEQTDAMGAAIMNEARATRRRAQSAEDEFAASMERSSNDMDRSIAERKDREEKERELAERTDEYASMYEAQMERSSVAFDRRAETEAYLTEQTNEYARMFEASINAPLIAAEDRKRAEAREKAKTRTTAEGTFSGWRLGDQFTQQAVEKEQLTELKRMNENFRKLLAKDGKKPDFYT